MIGMIVPTKTYYTTFAALMVLTVLTAVIAGVDLGAFNTPAALLIAGAKAVMVVLIFMHIRGADPLVQLFAAGGFIWFGVLLVLTLSDVLTRGWLPPAATGN